MADGGPAPARALPAVKGILLALALLALLGVPAALLLPGHYNQLLTIATLHRIDDYPLYVLEYRGAYGLSHPLAGAPVEAGASQAWGCTCLAALNPEGQPVFGRNFDWHDRASMVLFTDPPDGYASVSMVDLAIVGVSEQGRGQGPLSLADRRELLQAPHMPIDGMNERGLAVGMMAVPEAQSSSDPTKMRTGSLEVIRLVLDYAGDVEEAIRLFDSCSIDFESGPPLHYMVADRSGRSAVIEFVGGKMAVLRNEQPWQVSTNFLISPSPPVGATAPCRRYNEAYKGLEAAQGRLTLNQATQLLGEVSQEITMWSVTYNLATGEIELTMGRKYEQPHHLWLDLQAPSP